MRVWLIRGLLYLIAALLIAIGSIPLTPLIWLLVILRVQWWPLPFRLQFWQTQTIGLVMVAAGIGLIIAVHRRAAHPPPPADNPRDRRQLPV